MAVVLPAALAAARERLFADGLYFAPLRHHSPACAFALQAMLRELRPAAVLIEGPDGFTDMLPLLLDERTRPPVALLCQTRAPAVDGQAHTQSAFFPFCDYSPEWVALKTGQETGAQLAFIDLPWQARAGKEHALAFVSGNDLFGTAQCQLAEKAMSTSRQPTAVRFD